MVKLRIISDLHYTTYINGPDHNKTYKGSGLYHYFGREFAKETDCVTLIAGDITESVEKHEECLKAFFPNQKVIFIDGNHVCYFRDEYGAKPILSEIKQQLKEKFPIDHLLYNYLENDWMWIPNTNVAVIGSTFYTDYKYCDMSLDQFNDILKAWDIWAEAYGLISNIYTPLDKLTPKIIQQETMSEANSRMNDFKWGLEKRGVNLSAQYYLKLHKIAKKEVQRCYNEIVASHPNAKIILMTHHCLSPQVIESKYRQKLINSSYVSNLEKWVDKMPNIRLVVSGHVHNRNDFVFGKNKIRYITNPCGYIPNGEPFTKGSKFNPNLIIDTEDL